VTNQKPLLVSVKDACLLLGIGQTKVYALITERLLHTVTIGSRRLITMASIDALIEGAATNVA
jgi:excisionase family DNA binding protein